MLSTGLFKEVLKKTESSLLAYKELIQDQDHYFLFPFTIQGCVNVTEVGLKPEAITISDYTYFAKVVSGDHPVIATWEVSTYFIGKGERSKWMQNELAVRKKYTEGRFLKAALESDIQSLTLSNYEGEPSMTSLQESQEISVLVTEKLDKSDIFKLWIAKRFDTLDNYILTPDTDLRGLLDKNQIQFLYIREVRNHYTYHGNYCYSRVVFDSLNSKLADTGYSIANYVQLAYPGSGYAWPRIKLLPEKEIPVNQRLGYVQPKNKVLGKKLPPARLYRVQDGVKLYTCVKIDPWKVVDVGVWGAQLKINNTAIIHSVRLSGYPIKFDAAVHQDPDNPGVYNTGYIFAPRPLFAKKLLPAVNHPLNTHLKMEDTYYMVCGIQPVIDFYKDWKENKKSAYDESVKSTFEGHIRTNYSATTGKKWEPGDESNKNYAKMWQIWSDIIYYLEGKNPNNPPGWDNFLKWFVIDFQDSILDAARCLFTNIFSRRLPRWGKVNEKIKYQDLKYWTPVNILALNAIVHHDIITLPLGLNQTIVTETLDVVDDMTERIPILGGWINSIIKGIHGMIFGKSPSGFKRGGTDTELKFYGDSMVGFMSVEMYRFYTGTYYGSLNNEHRGIMPFNAFQDQGYEPLSTLLSATANSTGLNFKLTDIVEGQVYDTSYQDPKKAPKRIDVLSTVHIAQFPGKKNQKLDNPEGREVLGDLNEPELKDWKETEVFLVDENFNLHLSEKDERVVKKFGRNSDSQRLFIVNEASSQVISAGDETWTFFAQDPTIYGYEQVSIWEGKFRNYAKVAKSPRAWTTTIRFGQPNIQTIIIDKEGNEKLKDALYKYPMTILSDIQKRPHLPPPPIEVPDEKGIFIFFTYSYGDWDLEEEKIAFLDETPDNDIVKKDGWLGWKFREGGEPARDLVPIVKYYRDLSIWYLFQLKDDFYLAYDHGYLYHGEATKGGLAGLVNNEPTYHQPSNGRFMIKTEEGKTSWQLSRDFATQTWGGTEREPGKNTSNIPSLSTPWKYWHYYTMKDEDIILNQSYPDTSPTRLWYSGLASYKSEYLGKWDAEEK